MKVTIFTPTYNRADLLPRLYKSLCDQKIALDSDGDENPVFEWLIVDDGSTDDTLSVVRGLNNEKKLKIRYYQKPNGGKHTAINYGAKLAEGELFFIADSDDLLPANSISNVIKVWKDIVLNKDATKYAGVCGLDETTRGDIIGASLPCETMDMTYIEHTYNMGLSGDRKEVFLTSVMLESPFPEIPGEKFCPEALVWNRIATKYKLRYFNKAIYTAEYQDGGITSGITRVRMKSPIATMMTYSELLEYDIPLKEKIKAAINYWRFAFCAEKRDVKIAKWGFLFAPLGYLMHINDKRIVR